MDHAAIIARLLSYVAAAGGIRAFARQAGLSEVHVRDCIRGRKRPGPTLMASIGVERRITYVLVGGDA